MGILLEGFREIWHNFRNPIEDNNEPVAEISGDNFVAIARQSGLSQEAINELIRNRNGVNLPVRKSTNKVKDIDSKVTRQNVQRTAKIKNENEIGRE